MHRMIHNDSQFTIMMFILERSGSFRAFLLMKFCRNVLKFFCTSAPAASSPGSMANSLDTRIASRSRTKFLALPVSVYLCATDCRKSWMK